MAPKKSSAEGAIDLTPVAELRRLEDSVIDIPIRGITPVIPHKWAEKAKALMRAKHAGESVRGKKPPKDPQQDALDATYWLPGSGVDVVNGTGADLAGIAAGEAFHHAGVQPAMPATAFKAATVGACRFFDGLPMTKAKNLFFVEGEGTEQLVPLDGSVKMHEDTPRNADGTVDLRYRNYISDWTATLRVRFLASVLSVESIIALIDAGGRLGVGDWRPSAPKSATGTYGQYRVDIEE